GVVLWDSVARKLLVDKPLPEEGEAHSLAYSPDGKTIAAGSDGGVVLWDAVARKLLVDEPLRSGAHRVAFSPDGKTIAAGFNPFAESVGLVLWDVASRKRLLDKPLLMEGHRSLYLGVGVDFSPDGKTIAFGLGRDTDGGTLGVVLLWDVDLDSWQRRAGQIANRNFTRKEWREYFPETPYHATFPDLPVPPEVTPK
ncbi:MAG: WD40 repeat domain-containing protein, partial [Isosphaeraceae bacterium]